MREKNTYNEQFAKLALSCSLRSHHKANPTPKMAMTRPKKSLQVNT